MLGSPIPILMSPASRQTWQQSWDMATRHNLPSHKASSSYAWWVLDCCTCASPSLASTFNDDGAEGGVILEAQDRRQGSGAIYPLLSDITIPRLYNSSCLPRPRTPVHRARTYRRNPYPSYRNGSARTSGNEGATRLEREEEEVDGVQNDLECGKTLPVPRYFTREQRIELYDIQMQQAEEKKQWLGHFYSGTKLDILFKKRMVEFEG
jgi:hypothetical protein